jgi:tRNA (cytidine32/guanosine34-2'-O)-methyltransferase
MGKTTKDKRDIYYRKAKEEGYRARSAYKLLQIDSTFNIFSEVERVVDLCAAPGSWSQVIAKRLYESGFDLEAQPHLCSVDIFEIAPIQGAHRIQGDITRQKTVEAI